jgi:membrane protease YdiL (CAAX protease family)
MTLLLGLLAWLLSSSAILSLHQYLLHRQNKPATTVLSPVETVLFNALIEAVVLAAMVIASALLRRHWTQSMGLNLGRLPLGILGGVFALAIALPPILLLNAVVEGALEHFGEQHGPHPLLEVLKQNPPPWLSAADAVCTGLIAPIAEEFFFRGLLLTLVRSLFRESWPAILFSSAAFALVHPAWSWPQIFFLGLCLGYVYERTGNLWMTIAMHATFNLTSLWLFTRFG